MAHNLLENKIQKIKTKLQTLYKKYGWKAVVGIFAYYLIRDLTLYVAIPYFLVTSVTP